MLLAAPGAARAEEPDDAQPGFPPPTSDADAEPEDAAARRRGRRLVERAAAWLHPGAPPPERVRSLVCDLHDVKLDSDDAHREGHLRLWLEAPDRLRQEWRHVRDPRAGAPFATKILDGDRLWVVGPKGRVRRLHGSAGGARALRQVGRDRDLLLDLTRFLTLGGLMGPEAVFEDRGVVRGAPDTPRAGRWRRVVRRAPGELAIELHFAFARGAEGEDPDAVTYPGVVVVPGDPAAQRPTETFVLSRWRRAGTRRIPGRVEAYRTPVGEAPAKRFLLAFPETIRLDAAIEDARFRPPAQGR